MRRFVGSFASGGLSGLRVLVYQHSAVGRDLLPRILRELGADVCTAARSETFVPIDTENIADEELDRLEKLAVAAEGDGPLDAIVSTDGDSDRPLVIAVLPAAEAGPRGRRVRFLSGDLLGIVVAEYLGADAAAVPISSNDAVERRMAERGVFLRTTRIGSPYVVAALDEMRSAGAHSANRWLGGQRRISHPERHPARRRNPRRSSHARLDSADPGQPVRGERATRRIGRPLEPTARTLRACWAS